MNVYEANIWRSVYHDEKFSHTATRIQLIHALNEERARKQIELQPEKTWQSGPEHTIRASAETVYELRKTGTVVKRLFYVYSDGRPPRLVGGKK